MRTEKLRYLRLVITSCSRNSETRMSKNVGEKISVFILSAKYTVILQKKLKKLIFFFKKCDNTFYILRLPFGY